MVIIDNIGLRISESVRNIIKLIIILYIVQTMKSKQKKVIEVTDAGVEITDDMTREEKEYRSCWKDNPKVIRHNTDNGGKRGKPELAIFCKSYYRKLHDYQALLDGPKQINNFKKVVLEYRQIYHPVNLERSQQFAMVFVMGWIHENIDKSLYPPDGIIHVIKIFVLEADCHFRKVYWNPLDPNTKLWEDMEDFTDEETETAAKKQIELNNEITAINGTKDNMEAMNDINSDIE